MNSGEPDAYKDHNHLSVDLSCSKKSLIRARSKVFNFAVEYGFASVAQDVALAAQEALKNVVQHACPADNVMHFECVIEDDRLIIEVTDKGLGFDTGILDGSPASPLEVHGRGIRIIKGLMDDVWIKSDQEGTVVHMEKARTK